MMILSLSGVYLFLSFQKICQILNFLFHIFDMNVNQHTFREKKGAFFVNNEVYQEVYGHILNDAQRIRKEIMNEWGDTLMFGGTMPSEVLEDLSNVARITGLSFDALSGHGVTFTQVDGKPELYRLNVRGENYVCHKSAIPSMSGFLDVVNLPGVNQKQGNTASSVRKEQPVYQYENPDKRKNHELSHSEEDYDVQSESSPYQGNEQTALEDYYDTNDQEYQEEEYQEEEYQEDQSSYDYANNDDSDESMEYQEEQNYDSEEDYEEQNNDEYQQEYDASSSDEQEDAQEEEEMEYPQKKAEIIGGSSKISSFAKKDIFMEESQKNVDDIVYEMFDINLSHSGYSGGGRPEKMTIMIAPLKIQKFATTIVPIIVSIYYNGKIITKSSYDQAEDGKNLVTMDVNEFYLLFRGSFDANGKFKGYVTTTGISAGQGDILTVSSDVSYGETDSRTVNNGHIKIRSVIDDADGVIEVFPFGEPENDEFILMTKNDEFVDYMYISDGAKGLKKPLIYSDGVRKQAICSWDKDHEIMSFELKEV